MSQPVFNFFFSEFLGPHEEKIHPLPVVAKTYEEAITEARQKYQEKINEAKGLVGNLLLMT